MLTLPLTRGQAHDVELAERSLIEAHRDLQDAIARLNTIAGTHAEAKRLAKLLWRMSLHLRLAHDGSADLFDAAVSINEHTQYDSPPF